MRGKRILVTGGAGFIGSHLIDKFILGGAKITALDNLATGNIKNLNSVVEKITYVQGDIRDRELVEGLVQDCDLVVHLAAALGVKNIMEKTVESISTNIYGSEVILSSSAKFNKKILIASTSEVYGKNPKQPLSENDDRVIGTPQNIRWSYSDAKAIEEAMAQALFYEKRLQVVTVRFFNTVGPRQTGQYGMVIPRFVKNALEGKDLEIYGDGSQSRVFCHVDDATDGVLKLLKEDKAVGEVFNIGGIGEISILDLAKKVIELTKSESQIKFRNYEEIYGSGFEDMQRRVPNIEKIKNFVDWEPKQSLENIINDVSEYLLLNPNRD